MFFKRNHSQIFIYFVLLITTFDFKYENINKIIDLKYKKNLINFIGFYILLSLKYPHLIDMLILIIFYS